MPRERPDTMLWPASHFPREIDSELRAESSDSDGDEAEQESTVDVEQGETGPQQELRPGAEEAKDPDEESRAETTLAEEFHKRANNVATMFWHVLLAGHDREEGDSP